MTFKTHLALGALGALGLVELSNLGAFSNALSNLNPLPNLSTADILNATPFILLGSVLPDIDEPRSFIGKKLPIISHLTRAIFSHRGPTHFVFIPILLFIFALIFSDYALILSGLAFGILCHHFGDLLTPSGISSYFFPLSFGKFKHTARILPKMLSIKTGSFFEISVLLPLVLLLDSYLAYTNFGANFGDDLLSGQFTKKIPNLNESAIFEALLKLFNF